MQTCQGLLFNTKWAATHHDFTRIALNDYIHYNMVIFSLIKTDQSYIEWECDCNLSKYLSKNLN